MSTMGDEISAAYDSAMAAGKYITMRGSRHYATTSVGEYWAEGVQWWFFSNYGECFTGNVRSRRRKSSRRTIRSCSS
jgi:hypothetical protein